jgi:BirA family biotin operon repressor/biotin-[acetyl-CoA-carboxylase] ligase
MAQLLTPMQKTARIFTFDMIDSTNDEALRQLRAGTPAPFWVSASEQTRGRGRGSKPWISPPGNLYATCVIRPDVPPTTATQLSFVAALAAHDAVSQWLASPGAARKAHNRLALKWPNDLMLGEAKLGGILLESVQIPVRQPPAVLIGMGLNLAIAPELADRPTASVGLDIPESEKPGHLRTLTARFHQRLEQWQEGRNFGQTRADWLARAYRLGEPVAVRLQNERIEGRFRGIDADGALEVITASGKIRHVLSGEVGLPA